MKHDQIIHKSNITTNDIQSEYAIEMSNITKTFDHGKVVAVDNLSLKVKRNEIHAIVGENGAGKSTLMSVLFGIYKPENGEIKINGKVVRFASASDASKAGLGMVHQHFKLVEVYTLLENIILGAEMTKCGFLDKKAAAKKISELSLKYNLPVNLNMKISKASVGEQQRVEILKLLYREADILIFDEPTAVLSDSEIKGFLAMLLEFKKQGKTIIIITHKLNEVQAVADRGTVIRLGKFVGTFDAKTMDVSEITKMMIGKEIIRFIKVKNYTDKEQVVLDIKNLCVNKISQNKIHALNNFNLQIHKGEIYGLAGIEGNGQTELAMAIGGLLKPVSGSMKLFTNKTQYVEIEKNSIKDIYLAGVSHVPEDRQKYGLILDETVAINCVAQQIDQYPFSSHGFLNFRMINNYAKYLCVNFDVRGSTNGRAMVRSLSGGNQQKLILAREISRAHHLIIYVQPTRGLDLGAINFIHQKILDDAKAGAAVLLISYELDEIFAIANTIGVMDSGKITYQSSFKDTNRTKVGNVMSRSVTVQTTDFTNNKNLKTLSIKNKVCEESGVGERG